MEGGDHLEAPVPGLATLHARALQQVVAAARGLLRKRAHALEALHPEAEHEHVLVEEGSHEQRIGLAGLERHPVVAVRGKEGKPVVEPTLVEEVRLVVDEVHEVVAGGGAHPALSPAGIDIVMNRFQAANWLRICRSLVPFTIAVSPWSSSPARSRSRFTHSIPSETSPDCMRS